MSRILLADNSPHAKRMGERILREEGFEVVTVTDGETALLRLADVDPDLVIADVSLPGKNGYDLCREIRNRPRLRHVRVVLTAGLLDHLDESAAVQVRCDAVLRKPFEASAVMDTVRPLVSAAQTDRAEHAAVAGADEGSGPAVPVRVVAPSEVAREVAGHIDGSRMVDEERVRAAVTVALDAAMPALAEEITRQVLTMLRR